MHTCFETNISDTLDMLSKLHNINIFPKCNDDEDLKSFCDVLILEPGSTFGFIEYITFNLEAPNGGGR